MVHLVRGLREHGGEAASQDIYQWLEENNLADPADLLTIQKDGGTRFKKEVRWARKELFDAGLISAPRAGVWALTSDGAQSELTIDDARALVRMRSRVRRGLAGSAPTDMGTTTQMGLSNSAGMPTTGPIPSDWTGEVTRTTTGPAHTYLMQFGRRDIWKVGHAQCVETRARELNRHIPYEILGEKWELRRSLKWPSSTLAYHMEQALLNGLKSKRSTGERVLCDLSEVIEVWDRLIGVSASSGKTETRRRTPSGS